jgi:hypothetical protein
MLAAMLLPAVNAAREAARRATCMNNQSQLALACLNYDGAKQNLPPMRAQIAKGSIPTTPSEGGGGGEGGEGGEGGGGSVSNAGEGSEANEPQAIFHHASWIGHLLPYMELNQLYQNLTSGQIHNDSETNDKFYTGNNFIIVKSFRCPSAEIPVDKTGIHYVCNGGYQNARATNWTGTATRNVSGQAWDPGKRADAVFFDHLALTQTDTSCNVTVSIDYISSHSGTGNTLLLSENINNVRWAYWGGTNNVGVTVGGELEIASCYPWNTYFTSFNATGKGTANPAVTRMAEYPSDDNTTWSHQGYTNAALPQISGDQSFAAFFINVAKGNEYDGAYGSTYRYRRARPSSHHPGIVLGAFADRSVRPLSESMDQRIFVWICQPNSGQVLGGDSF